MKQGTYSSQPLNIPTGYSAASACTQAQSGYYSPGTTGGTNVGSTVTTIASDELPCPAGTYSSFTASNSSADRASCFDAPAGSYSEGTNTINGVLFKATSAIECSAGSWQDQIGQADCNVAEPGYFVDTTGQTEQTPCEAGTYSSQNSSTACTSASSGYYSPGSVGGQNVDSGVTTLATSQIMCHAGYYSNYTTSTPNTDRVECDETDAGYYSLGTYTQNGTLFSATEQIPCPSGTYQPNTTQSSCIEADKGFVAYGTYNGIDVSAEITNQAYVSTSQEACEAGKFTNQTGQVECLMTQKGYYSLGTVVTNGVIVNLADDQVPCPAGTYQGEIEQSSCDNASAGHYSLGTYTHNGVTFPATGETACVAGTYQPNTGQSSCIDADAGYYAHSGTGSGNGTVNQQACAVGTWQNQTGQSECILAESGYYSLGTTTLNGAVTNLANQQVAWIWILQSVPRVHSWKLT